MYQSVCTSFLRAVKNQYLGKDQIGKPGTTSWWHNNAGIVDFTNPAAAAWWKARLELIRTETGIDSFKFDAGETNMLPYSIQLTRDDALHPIQTYTQKSTWRQCHLSGV
jgi:alpha-glucosidase (family GH31 glycosyl hydrolase)